MRDRIVKYLDFKGISKYKFYQDTGLSNGFLDKSGGISVNSYEKICSAYPDLDVEWLRTGRGGMLKTHQPEDKETALSVPLSQCVTYHPDIPVTATASDVPDLSYEDRRNKVLMYIPEKTSPPRRRSRTTRRHRTTEI